MRFLISLVSSDLKDVSDKQVYRYMGMKAPSDEHLQALVRKLKPRFLDQVNCKACYGIVPVEIHEDLVDLSVISVKSSHLARNLRNCEYAVLFAATLGTVVEQQRRRAAAISPVEALILDAMGSAGIESFCDWLCSEFAKEYSSFQLRPRFSPGYGDFSLEIQEKLLRVLDAQRQIGVSITDGFLMIPQKSVTAVVGLSRTGCTAPIVNCECCDRVDCEFRL